MTLCIDLENVFLARIDLNDKHDAQRFETCQEIEKNFIILKKEGIINPAKCTDPKNCSKRIFAEYCACNLKVYNIRPHTFEIIGAIRPFFEMVALSSLSFKEVQFVVEHLEKILNHPIIEKNKRTKKRVQEMKEMEQNQRNGDRIGRFKPKLLKK